ncbi:hypothetical protein KUCAC02_036420, partial [Chaenocephalus aceratus]
MFSRHFFACLLGNLKSSGRLLIPRLTIGVLRAAGLRRSAVAVRFPASHPQQRSLPRCGETLQKHSSPLAASLKGVMPTFPTIGQTALPFMQSSAAIPNSNPPPP